MNHAIFARNLIRDARLMAKRLQPGESLHATRHGITRDPGSLDSLELTTHTDRAGFLQNLIGQQARLAAWLDGTSDEPRETWQKRTDPAHVVTLQGSTIEFRRELGAAKLVQDSPEDARSLLSSIGYVRKS